jgi:hypothetical protein
VSANAGTNDRVLAAGGESIMLAMAGDKIARLHVAIGAHLTDIASLFKGDVKLTLVARAPEHPDGSRDVVVTDDDLAAVVGAIELRART